MPTLDDGSHAAPAPRAADEVAPGTPTPGRPVTPAAVPDPAAELRLLHEFLRLATTARTWEELLETVVDGTRDALRASVTSLYLLERDGLSLRLAATNGLDRHQIGRAIVPLGEGITGRVAAMRQPMVIADVPADDRFLWVRGIDQRRFVHSMLSVPLAWRDQVVGVLNVQTETHRDFTDADVAQASAIADLLAGIVEKGRLQAEAEAQVEQLIALDRARSELIALVTHELRTPLAVVRAYTDLLADEPPLVDRSSRDPKRRATRAAWHAGTLEQIERLDRLVDSILTSVRVVPDQPAALETIDLAPTVANLADELEPMLGRHRTSIVRSRRLHVMADPARLRQVLEHLLENAVKYAPPDTRVEIGWRLVEGIVHIGIEDEGPGIPPEWRERIFEPYARRETSTARGSGIGLYAARRLAESMKGRLWCEPGSSGGARFVLALPAAVAV
ncbi:MAG TPA: HAMP domain-containing sensor histidine kinase [Candidatus Limnocylindrales bacterium]|nr:HAMP domain-containing sensor histidine kinase [Candidatus Limnocylindrales bacterium]